MKSKQDRSRMTVRLPRTVRKALDAVNESEGVKLTRLIEVAVVQYMKTKYAHVIKERKIEL